MTGYVTLRADRRQADADRGQARSRPAAVLLRRRHRGAHRRRRRSRCTSGSASGAVSRCWWSSSVPTGAGFVASSSRAARTRRRRVDTDAAAVRPLRLLRVQAECENAWRGGGLAGLRREHPPARARGPGGGGRAHDRRLGPAKRTGRDTCTTRTSVASSARPRCRWRRATDPSRHRRSSSSSRGRRSGLRTRFRAPARSPMTATSSSTSRGTRSGRPSDDLFFLSGLYLTCGRGVDLRRALGARPRRAAPHDQGARGVLRRAPRALSLRCTSTTTTTPSGPRSSA